jgi:hypothetical protein
MTPAAENNPLKVVDRPGGFAVIAVKAEAEVLEPLFRQYRIECKREQGATEDTFIFTDAVDRKQVQQILLEFQASET